MLQGLQICVRLCTAVSIPDGDSLDHRGSWGSAETGQNGMLLRHLDARMSCMAAQEVLLGPSPEPFST